LEPEIAVAESDVDDEFAERLAAAVIKQVKVKECV